MNNIVATLCSATIFLTSFLHVSNLSNYVLSLRIGLVPWHFWAASIVLCAFFAIFSGFTIKLPRFLGFYLGWVALFLIVCLSSLFLVNNSFTSMQTFIGYGWFFAVSFAICFLARTPQLIRACGAGIVAAVILLSVLTIMEFFDPNFQVIVDAYFEDKYKVGQIGRAGGMYENPNDNGTAMVLGMFVGLFFLPGFLRFPFILLVGFATFGTVSRGSLTVWALAVVVSMFFGFVFKASIVGRLLGLSMVVALGVLLVTGQIPVLLADLGAGDLLSVNMAERLSQNFFTQDDGSGEARLIVAGEAWTTFTVNPIFGLGLGRTSSLGDTGNIGTHNQLLTIAAEMGVLGALVYLGLIVVAFNSGSLIAVTFILLFMVIGFTNHGMLTYTVYAVLIPAALVLIPQLHRLEAKQTKRKRRRRRSTSIAERELSA